MQIFSLQPVEINIICVVSTDEIVLAALGIDEILKYDILSARVQIFHLRTRSTWNIYIYYHYQKNATTRDSRWISKLPLRQLIYLMKSTVIEVVQRYPNYYWLPRHIQHLKFSNLQ